MLDREYVIPPFKTLYSRETGFAPDAPADVLARPLVIPCSPDPPRSERPAVIPRDVPQKAKPRVLAYRARRTSVTIEKIRALQRQGLGVEVIAARLGCHGDTIYARIREANGGATRPKRILSAEQSADIVRRREAGEQPKDLAREYGIGRNRVYELCKVLKTASK